MQEKKNKEKEGKDMAKERKGKRKVEDSMGRRVHP